MAGSTQYGVPRVIQASRFGEVDPVPAGAIPRIQYSTGMASALANFAQDMFSMSSRLQDRLDDQARAEAAVEGATDGSTGNVVLRDYSTIRGQAYNRAAIEAAAATLETQSIYKMDELQRQYWNDPEGLAKASAAYNDGVGKQIDKFDPAAGIAYRRNAALRTLPAVEQARDMQYKLTRSEADARLIEAEAAIQTEVRKVGADLFSDNPARSQAAAQSIAISKGRYMAIYDAVDPGTGKPLYSPEERAKAERAFNDMAMESASLSWFDGQSDKGAAFIKFQDKEFKFETRGIRSVDATGNAGVVADVLTGKGWSQIAVAAIVGGLQQESGRSLHSGAVGDGGISFGIGQWNRERLTNLKRFAAHRGGDFRDIRIQAEFIDFELRTSESRAGEALSKARTVEEAAAAAIGYERPKGWRPDAPHMGHGWNNRLANAKRLAAGGTVETKTMRLGDAMTPAALLRVEDEMRARIRFSNEMADRTEREAERNLRDRQDRAGFELTNRLLNGGRRDEATGLTIDPLSRSDVAEAVRLQAITGAQGEAILRAMATEAPARSDREVYGEALKRVYSQENIFDYVIEHRGQLSDSDAAELLARNQSLNVDREGSLTKEQQFHFDNLQKSIAPVGEMGKIDPDAQLRSYAAADEFRQRVMAGENARTVANELIERARVDMYNSRDQQFSRLLLPRFAVQGDNGYIDVGATLGQLKAAHDAGRIADEAYLQQIELVKEWSDLQNALKVKRGP